MENRILIEIRILDMKSMWVHEAKWSCFWHDECETLPCLFSLLDEWAHLSLSRETAIGNEMSNPYSLSSSLSLLFSVRRKSKCEAFMTPQQASEERHHSVLKFICKNLLL